MTVRYGSYTKTLLAGVLGGGVGILGAIVATHSAQGAVSSALAALAWFVATLCLLVVTSTLVVVGRERYQRLTSANPFEALNRARSEATLAAGRTDVGLRLRHALRQIFGSRGFAVGELVEVRPYDEILATLDEVGRVEALPFMPEMRRFCGTRARIFRRVDKIYDYGGKKDLRRLDDAYLLIGLRCDGSAHGDCQAHCYLLWKSSWLKRVRGSTDDGKPHARQSSGESDSVDVGAKPLPVGGGSLRYRCQFTELVAASAPLSTVDYRQDLRPLLAGNVTLRAFCLAICTRIFNFVQRLRGGVGYPALPPPGAVPRAESSLRRGDEVIVRDAADIVATLDGRLRNRGLYFDPEMTKYCGRPSVIKCSVDRIIDDATGLMRTMKSPCLVLEDVDYTGETLRFVAQHEHLFWRDLWLSPLKPAATVQADSVDGSEPPAQRRAASEPARP
jgi:hypothetical protein